MMRSIYTIFFLLIFTSYLPVSLAARETGKETGLPLPRFVVFKFAKSNLRNGPGLKYCINWIYVKKDYPMEVIAEFENWRKLRDIDGTEGWINESLISGKRNVIIIDNKFTAQQTKYQLKPKEMLIFRHPDEKSYPIARVEFGVIANIKKCTEQWCKIKVDKHTGWIRKENIWGIYPEEIIG